MTNGPGASSGQTTQTGAADADQGAQQSSEGNVTGPPGILVGGRGANQSWHPTTCKNSYSRWIADKQKRQNSKREETLTSGQMFLGYEKQGLTRQNYEIVKQRATSEEWKAGRTAGHGLGEPPRTSLWGTGGTAPALVVRGSQGPDFLSCTDRWDPGPHGEHCHSRWEVAQGCDLGQGPGYYAVSGLWHREEKPRNGPCVHRTYCFSFLWCLAGYHNNLLFYRIDSPPLYTGYRTANKENMVQVSTGKMFTF